MFLVWLLRGFIHRDDEKGRRMWNMYLEREDSKVVGKSLTMKGFRSTLSSFTYWMWPLVSRPSFRSVCRTAEKLHDLHRLRLPLHCVRPILGPLHSYCTGQNTSLVWLSGSEHLVSAWVESISCSCFLTGHALCLHRRTQVKWLLKTAWDSLQKRTCWTERRDR